MRWLGEIGRFWGLDKNLVAEWFFRLSLGEYRGSFPTLALKAAVPTAEEGESQCYRRKSTRLP